jgi:hypothetical protein
MKIRSFWQVVIITVTQFAILPGIDIFECGEVSCTRRIVDGVEVDSFHGNLFTRTIIVCIVSSYEHHVNNSIPNVMQFGSEQPTVVQKQEVTACVDQTFSVEVVREIEIKRMKTLNIIHKSRQ